MFVEKLEHISRIIKKVYDKVIRMKDLADVENHQFKTATLYHICNMKMGEDRVRDHDHLTGNYRGAAHSNCNLNYNNIYLSSQFWSIT